MSNTSPSNPSPANRSGAQRPPANAKLLADIIVLTAPVKYLPAKNGRLSEIVIRGLTGASAEVLTPLLAALKVAKAPEFKVVAVRCAIENPREYAKDFLLRLSTFKGRHDTLHVFFETFDYSNLEELGKVLQRRPPTLAEKIALSSTTTEGKDESATVVSSGSLTRMTTDPHLLYVPHKSYAPYLCGEIQRMRVLSLINPKRAEEEEKAAKEGKQDAAKSTAEVIADAFRRLGLSADSQDALEKLAANPERVTGTGRSHRKVELQEAIVHLQSELARLQHTLAPLQRSGMAELLRVPLIAETPRGLERRWFESHLKQTESVPAEVRRAFVTVFDPKSAKDSIPAEQEIARQILFAYQFNHKVVDAHSILKGPLEDLAFYKQLAEQNPKHLLVIKYGSPSSLLPEALQATFEDTNLRVPFTRLVELLNQTGRLTEFRADYAKSLIEKLGPDLDRAEKYFEQLWAVRLPGGGWARRTTAEGGPGVPRETATDKPPRVLSSADYLGGEFAPKFALTQRELLATRAWVDHRLLNPQQHAQLESLTAASFRHLAVNSVVALRKIDALRAALGGMDPLAEGAFDKLERALNSPGETLSKTLPLKGRYAPVELLTESAPLSLIEIQKRSEIFSAGSYALPALPAQTSRELNAWIGTRRKLLPAVVSAAATRLYQPEPTNGALEQLSRSLVNVKALESAVYSDALAVLESPVIVSSWSKSGPFNRQMLSPEERSVLEEVASYKVRLDEWFTDFGVSSAELSELQARIRTELERVSKISRTHNAPLYVGGFGTVPKHQTDGTWYPQKALMAFKCSTLELPGLIHRGVSLTPAPKLGDTFAELFNEPIRKFGRSAFLATGEGAGTAERHLAALNPSQLLALGNQLLSLLQSATEESLWRCSASRAHERSEKLSEISQVSLIALLNHAEKLNLKRDSGSTTTAEIAPYFSTLLTVREMQKEVPKRGVLLTKQFAAALTQLNSLRN